MISRRHLIGGSAAAVLLPGLAWGQAGTTRARLPWSSFKAGPHYGAFRDAIAQMRRNQDPNDPGSMLFWANAHQFHCPHGVDHFLAWHRAYLALFERQLQTLSGISDLALPYWDYYSNPRIPAEFTQGPAATNPLAHPRRGLNVGAALSLAPFAAAVTRFPNRERDSFEYEVEDRPHNMVHSLIGRDMVTMQSPRDPIFWLHHANIDRLWSAWAGAGGGRAMPDAGDSYWSGDFHYGGGLAAPKAATRDTHSAFGYRYQNETMPILLPTTAPPRPPFKRFDPDFPIRLRPNFFAVGPSTSLELGA
ncbi:MAG TPA: tyrosinase family protein, partial [Allosphingosinicella sp.]